MKKIFLLLLSIVAIGFTACHDPEYVEPTVNRQYLTSLTATILSGDAYNGVSFTLSVTDESITDFVIPIPYYYPETSDNETDKYLPKMRLLAGLAPNYKIEPELGSTWDLTKKHAFTITGPEGLTKQITISAERKKSSEADFLTFGLEGTTEDVTAVINAANATITLVPSSTDPIVATGATYTLSAHAQGVSPDPATITEWNDPLTLTVTAHDGTTKEWTVSVGQLEKIDEGVNDFGSAWSTPVDIVSGIGEDFKTDVAIPSLAAIGPYLVVCKSGATPVYLDKMTGAKMGEVALPGGFTPSSITNDGAENLLLCNAGNNGNTISIYTTSDVTVTPTLLHSFTCTVDNTGYSMKAIGDITGDAVITLMNTGGDQFGAAILTQVVIKSGAVSDVSTVTLTCSDMTADKTMTPGPASAPSYVTDVAAASTDPATDGYFYARPSNWHNGSAGNHFFYLDGTGAEVSRMATGVDGFYGYGGYWVNSVDCKEFNNVVYVAVSFVDYFSWASSYVTILNATNKSNLTGTLSDSPATVYKATIGGTTHGADGGNWASDVVLAPSKSGYYLYMYVYNMHQASLTAYVADCIKQ